MNIQLSNCKLLWRKIMCFCHTTKMNEPVVGLWGGGGKGVGLNRFDKHFSFICIDCLIKNNTGTHNVSNEDGLFASSLKWFNKEQIKQKTILSLLDCYYTVRNYCRPNYKWSKCLLRKKKGRIIKFIMKGVIIVT